MPVPSDRREVERHLLRDTAYAAIRDAIVNGTLAPGERLHDAELCTWLNLSRTPVREALARLEDERLVQTVPQRYTRVTPLDLEDAHDSFPILAAVHALAVELAVPCITRHDIEALRAANRDFVSAMEAGDVDATYEADDHFHGIFVRTAGNSELDRVIGRMSARLRRFEHLRDGALPGRRSAAQHEAIIARSAAGDASGAASATRENWLHLGALIERSLARLPAD